MRNNIHQIDDQKRQQQIDLIRGGGGKSTRPGETIKSHQRRRAEKERKHKARDETQIEKPQNLGTLQNRTECNKQWGGRNMLDTLFKTEILILNLIFDACHCDKNMT